MSVIAESPKVERVDQPWRVMVVEDNDSVAMVHRKIVDAVPYLKTAHVAFNGEHAYSALPAVRPDLVILDLTMPGGDGMTFLRRLRRENLDIDVIVVTASRASKIVSEAMHLGIVDYLVKPFSPQRMRQSMSEFALRRQTLACRSELRQADVDSMRGAGAVRGRRRLPKGLRETTMKEILAALDRAADPRTADEIGREVGVARVTARRYLEFLTLMGMTELTRESSGPGRPRNHYRRVPKKDRP